MAIINGEGTIRVPIAASSRQRRLVKGSEPPFTCSKSSSLPSSSSSSSSLFSSFSSSSKSYIHRRWYFSGEVNRQRFLFLSKGKLSWHYLLHRVLQSNFGAAIFLKNLQKDRSIEHSDFRTSISKSTAFGRSAIWGVFLLNCQEAHSWR